MIILECPLKVSENKRSVDCKSKKCNASIHIGHTRCHYSKSIFIKQYQRSEQIEIPGLSRREKEVLGLIAEGYTNPEIAEKLFISSFTVNSHRKNLIAKLNVKNTASLVKLAV